ncbi:InlB B-repeat-containing protein [Bifidobacterium sp. H1HS10N]|uniref:RCC1 domain-containing protein n=1 Tax=Bifidobacterium kimbladii TaxID=1293826 RepID=UPI0028BE5294|nr:InlB B-repeat-containing protein [Bifidobacterium sp. H1HS10N]MDT7512266.1 InlB B-repeat-containing protein [Bifidobacterium sp. H1HS10N]
MRFDPVDGSKPTQSTVKTGTLAAPPQQNPQRDGFRFDGWTLDNQPFDLQTPILQDTTLKARWTKITDWTLSPDHGPAAGARLTISPPDRQEPQFASLDAAGDQTVGLTGDGRIYTWTQDSPPKQVPFPAQAPDGFRYQQVAAGSKLYAAIGSDQQIYTWTSQQPTPTLLDTSRSTQFSSISINDERILAVDQQGQVHAYQASDADSQNLKPKFTEQATTSLPAQARAVLAVASGSRILALDSDGQAWTWEASNTGKAKPASVKQNPEIRITQSQTISQGFLLLDADGQAWYLANNTTNSAAINLPEGIKASRVTTSSDQAIIIDTDGQAWAWKPGGTPIRSDNGSQAYMQAAASGSLVTAVDRLGSLYRWSLDKQSRPGKPAKIDTTAAPTLESASMDGQALTLNKKDSSWQTEVPAHQPGPAAITISSRQDGQPFTRRLDYTVDQTLLRDFRQASVYTVGFDSDGGSLKPDPQQVSYPLGRVQRPTPDPTREGYQFDGWFRDNIAYDFSKPVTQNFTLTAHWTFKNPNNVWRISPNKGSQLGRQQTTITPPANGQDIRFNQISSSKSNGVATSFSSTVGSDGNAYAWGYNSSGQLGDGTRSQRNSPTPVKTPNRTTYTDLPTDFTYVQVTAGGKHSLAIGSDGYVYAWGDNSYGELGNRTTGGYSAVPVRVFNPATRSNVNTGLKAIQVSAGNGVSLAIDTNGNTWAWGHNNYGQLGNGTTSNSNIPVRVQYPASAGTVTAVQLSTGYYHTVAIDTNGNTWAWGYNGHGQLGNGTGSDSSAPVRVQYPASAGTVTAVQVSAGGYHSVAIDKDGNTWAWGWNGYGQLGNTSGSSSSVPVRTQYPASAGTVTAVQVSTGTWHSLAIDKDGNAWAWGDNSNGQLGDNTASERDTPVKVLASAQSTSSAGPWLNVVQVSAGRLHSLAVDKEGHARAWGQNSSGELGNTDIPTGDSTSARRLAPVSVMFPLQPVITAARFDTSPATNLTHVINSNSATVLTPAHQPGTVTVSVDYTMGGAGGTLTDTSLRYMYNPVGVLPQAGGQGILLALATGMTGMGGVLASRRHRREQHRLLHASLE